MENGHIVKYHLGSKGMRHAQQGPSSLLGNNEGMLSGVEFSRQMEKTKKLATVSQTAEGASTSAAAGRALWYS